MEIIVPVAPDGGEAGPISRRVSGLQDKVIGLLDNDWSSYNVFLDGIEKHLKHHAVKATKRVPNLPRRGMLSRTALDTLAGEIDTAIVGLGA